MGRVVLRLGSQSQGLTHSFVYSDPLIDALAEFVVGLDHPQTSQSVAHF